jgi:hypothetical protein
MAPIQRSVSRDLSINDKQFYPGGAGNGPTTSISRCIHDFCPGVGSRILARWRAFRFAACAGPWIESNYDFAPRREPAEILYTKPINAAKLNVLSSGSATNA